MVCFPLKRCDGTQMKELQEVQLEGKKESNSLKAFLFAAIILHQFLVNTILGSLVSKNYNNCKNMILD